MTRFDADTATDRRKLFADAIQAHRIRDSAFLTIEAELTEAEEATAAELEEEGTDEGAEEFPTAPWVQFAEQTVNLDCTDEELDRMDGLLDEYPEFRIDQMESPENAEGTNIRITARSDVNRLAGFIDQVFQEVYERPEDYTAWVVAI